MARVMFYTGLSMLGISAVLLYLPICFSCVLAAVFLVIFVSGFFLKAKFKISGIKVFALISLIFCLLGIFTVYQRLKPAEALAGYKAEVVCTVKDYPVYYNTYTAYTVESESIKIIPEKGQAMPSEVPQNIKMRLTDVNSLDFKVFDKVKLEVTLNPLDEFRASSLGNGIYIGGYINRLYDRLGENRPFYALFYDFREYLNELLYDNINYDDASVISAAVLGDMDRLDNDFYINSKVAVVSHVLVVSGMHLGIVFQVLSYILGVLGVRGRKFSLILMASVFAVTAICGFTPSILRAGLTYFILALGMFFYRRPDPLNSLGLAAVIILFTSPFSFGNVSLLLSLASTFGLLYFCPFFYNEAVSLLSRKWQVPRPVKALLLSVFQTLSATLTTLPICIAYFGYISAVSVFANLLIGYPTTLLLSLSVLTLALLMLPGVLKAAATLPIVAICLLSRYTVYVTNWFGSLDFALIATHISYLWVWLIFIALLIGLMLLFTLKRIRLKYKVISFVSLALVTVLLSATCYAFIPKSRFAVLRLGKGCGAVLCYEGDVYLFGAGDGANDANTIESYLLSVGERKIDYLILPTLSKAYAGGAAALDQKMDIENIILPNSGDFYNKLKYVADERYFFFNKNATITLKNGVDDIDILADSGALITLKNDLFAVQCGNLDLSSYKELNANVLVTDIAPKKAILNYDFENIVISGDPTKTKKVLNSTDYLKGAVLSDETREFIF